MALRIQMLGRFEIRDGKLPIEGIDRRGLELLGYLLLNRDRPQTREAVASRLWPDLPPQLTRKYLRHAIWAANAGLRAAFGSPNGARSPGTRANGGPALIVARDPGLLTPADPIWLDLDEFERAFQTTAGRAGPTLDAESAMALESAVGLYSGDLLEGWYVEWCEEDRRRAQAELIAMLDKLVAYHGARGAIDAALAAGLHILTVDRARERTHRQVMRLRYEAGDRTGALRQYQACVDALSRELGVRPSRRTTELYRQIKLDRVDPPAPAMAVHSTTPSRRAVAPSPSRQEVATVADLSGVLDALRTLRDSVDDLERRLDREIASVEGALGHRFDDL